MYPHRLKMGKNSRKIGSVCIIKIKRKIEFSQILLILKRGKLYKIINQEKILNKNSISNTTKKGKKLSRWKQLRLKQPTMKPLLMNYQNKCKILLSNPLSKIRGKVSFLINLKLVHTFNNLRRSNLSVKGDSDKFFKSSI